MDIGQLYDDAIASHYDADEFGLLSGSRALAISQLTAHVDAARATDVLDLAAGTGESLVAMRALMPEARLHGIDLSEKMLAIAQEKLAFRAIHDDVNHAGRHVAPGSVDVALMHFLTTFVDGAKVVADTSALLRPGGLYSIVSTTYEAFPLIQAIGTQFLGEAAIHEMAPAPRDLDEVAGFFTAAGLEVVEAASFERTLTFDDFPSFYAFGMNSGFFTHILSRLGAAQIDVFANLPGVFPLSDTYTSAIVLARKPA